MAPPSMASTAEKLRATVEKLRARGRRFLPSVAPLSSKDLRRRKICKSYPHIAVNPFPPFLSYPGEGNGNPDHVPRGGRSDSDGIERDSSDDRDEYDREKSSSSRRENQEKERDDSSTERNRESTDQRDRGKYRSRDRSWESGEEKDRVHTVDDRSHDQNQNRWKGNRDRDTGLRPQNFIRDVELADRFEEYPKLKELISRKDQLIAKRATPPMYMQCDLRTTELSPDVFGTKFDVILVDPPWEEYVRRAPGSGDSMEWWPAEEIQNLRIEAIADTPAFIFLWVGDAEGLEQGRLCLKKWGFRRCEDICWVKTNRENPTPALRHDSNTLFQHSKEHCLMGIKGTVRRSTDGHIIHANVDTDIIISEEPEYGSTKKPEELYHIIEHFAQGMRRIELFGEDHNIRAGWVTVGKGLTSSNFNPQTYSKNFADTEGKVWQGGRGNPAIDAHHLVGTTPEIEALRPKSPPPRPQQAQPSGQGNAGNSISQPSAGNSISKKTSTGQVGGVQNGHPAPLIPGAGHGSANPPGTGAPVIGQPPYVGGRGGGHGQIPKLRPVLPGSLMKPLGAGPGLGEMGGFDEEASYGGDGQEATSVEDAPN